jgi:TRAP-type C4-dicarboxylate transport system substrate-binding protein
VEGAEGPITSAYGSKFHEAAQYGYLTNHIVSSAHITMNEKAFQSLPPDLQKVVEEAAREAVQWSRGEAQKVSVEAVDKMKAEGGKISAIDTTPFKARLEAAVSKAEAEGLWTTKGLWKQVQDIK